MKSIHTDSYRGFRGCCFVAGEVTENQPGIAVVSAEDREALLHFYELYKYEWYNRWALDGLLQEAVSELHGRHRTKPVRMQFNLPISFNLK